MSEALVVDDTIADLAPRLGSWSHLVLVAADSEWLHRRDIAERTHLDARTVRGSLQDLREHGLAERKPYPADPRQSLHRAPPE